MQERGGAEEERDKGKGGRDREIEREREREREAKAGSMLSAEPNEALNPTTLGS